MKLSTLTLIVCLLTAACASPAAAKEEPASETTAATGERVQPEIRYYEIADT